MDIMADILLTAIGGVRKTRIMYRCNLSFKQLEAYLNLLLEKGLLTKVSKGETSQERFLKTTDKGKVFLRVYRGLQSLLAV